MDQQGKADLLRYLMEREKLTAGQAARAAADHIVASLYWDMRGEYFGANCASGEDEDLCQAHLAEGHKIAGRLWSAVRPYRTDPPWPPDSQVEAIEEAVAFGRYHPERLCARCGREEPHECFPDCHCGCMDAVGTEE